MRLAVFVILSNMPFWALAAAIILANLQHYRKRDDRSFSEILAGYLLLLPVGIGGIWWYIFETFFSNYIAEFQGWAPSHFAQQVAFGDIAIAVGGITAFFRKEYAFSLAVSLIACIFFSAMAIDHLTNLIFTDTWSLGNSGWTFSTDVITVIGLIVSMWGWKTSRHRT